MSPLSIATGGLLDYRTPLSIATDGLINLAVAEEEVRVIIPERRPGMGGGAVYVLSREDRLKYMEDRRDDIHRDDQEVVELILEAIMAGLL
jgi:hypothetical protein